MKNFAKKAFLSLFIVVIGMFLGQIQAYAQAQVSLTFQPQTPGQTQNFDDVPVDHPFYRAIEEVKKQGLMKGYEDGTFRPKVFLNRAELLKVALIGWEERNNTSITEEEQNGTEPENGEGQSAEDSVSCFKDVSLDAWYRPYVCMAKTNGIIVGYEEKQVLD